MDPVRGVSTSAMDTRRPYFFCVVSGVPSEVSSMVESSVTARGSPGGGALRVAAGGGSRAEESSSEESMGGGRDWTGSGREDGADAGGLEPAEPEELGMCGHSELLWPTSWQLLQTGSLALPGGVSASVGGSGFGSGGGVGGGLGLGGGGTSMPTKLCSGS